MTTRTEYETDEHLAKEAEVAETLRTKWNVELHKLPKSYRLDYVATRVQVPRAIVEVKVRSHASDTYPTLLIAAGKVEAGISLGALMGVRFIVVVQFTDKLMRAIWHAPGTGPVPPVTFRMGGRTDRADGADIEPCCLIPISAMKEIDHEQ